VLGVLGVFGVVVGQRHFLARSFIQ